MTILKRRVRPITFRVATEEYDVLSSACVKSGARSVAEFARLAVLQKASSCTSSPGTLSGDLATVSMALGERRQFAARPKQKNPGCARRRCREHKGMRRSRHFEVVSPVGRAVCLGKERHLSGAAKGSAARAAACTAGSTARHFVVPRSANHSTNGRLQYSQKGRRRVILSFSCFPAR